MSGLSSFYVDVLDLDRNVEAMLARAVEVGGDPVRGGDLLMRLQEHMAFLKYIYGHKHLAAPDCDGSPPRPRTAGSSWTWTCARTGANSCCARSNP